MRGGSYNVGSNTGCPLSAILFLGYINDLASFCSRETQAKVKNKEIGEA